MNKILSSEIISLVHHVKLNESGWWEKSIQNIIISTFGVNKNSPQSESDIFKNLKSELNGNFDKNRISTQIFSLKSKQQLINVSGDLFVLSEEVYSEFQTSFAKQKEIEFEAEKRFNELCYKLYPETSAKKLWDDLNQFLIIPLIREIGAKTYELISGENTISIEQYGQFQKFVNRYNGKKLVIQTLLLNYFDFKNVYVKNYILHQLNAYFFIESANLNTAAVEEVYALSKSQVNLKIFVDTNFLLTLLDLHDNPSNEAAFSLIELINEIKNKVKVKFYVLPVTIFEFQNLIKRFKAYLKRTKPSLNQAIAADKTDDFSGIIKRYFQKCHEKQTMLNIDDYFDPYLDNFTVNIRKKGLEIQQDNMDNYSTDQRVVDDLLEQVEYRFERNNNSNRYVGLSSEEKEINKEKIYDKFNHDCQLWHYVKDKRPTYIDSPKDVKNWILTLDFSFLEYDKFKQYNDANTKISVCLHPNEFISMLQFWIPRTEKFENAILGNFRLPFLFREIDGDSEKISMEILRAMSQYEDNEKFNSELVTEILTNKAIRQKIKVSNTIEENAELIKEELFKKYESTKKLLSEETEKKDSLSGELDLVKNQLGALTNKIEEFRLETNNKIVKEFDLVRKNKIQEIKNLQDSLKAKKDQLKSRIDDFDEQINKAEIEYNQNSKTLGTIIKSALVGKTKYLSDLQIKIQNKYYNPSKYKALKKDYDIVVKELEELDVPEVNEKIIIYCENQNSIFFNNLNFKNIHFIAENNSNSVFIKVVANQIHFGVRDRDYLTDNEIKKLQDSYSNYIILEYYCFENYLYHPDNIEELNKEEFDKKLYIEELIKQKNFKYDSILIKLKNSRNGYQEFKVPDNKFRESDEIICKYLKSDDIEEFLKSFSLKTEFDKTMISKLQLKQEELSSTEWFRKKMENLLSFR
jgi:predicted nucleic acid-binding protein